MSLMIGIRESTHTDQSGRAKDRTSIFYRIGKRVEGSMRIGLDDRFDFSPELSTTSAGLPSLLHSIEFIKSDHVFDEILIPTFLDPEELEFRRRGVVFDQEVESHVTVRLGLLIPIGRGGHEIAHLDLTQQESNDRIRP
jgi:hypothetical protein